MRMWWNIPKITMFPVILHEDETEYDAVVVDDKTSDLAILKIEADGLKPAVFGDVDQMEIGDEVLAIGNPGGLISPVHRQVGIFPL